MVLAQVIDMLFSVYLCMIFIRIFGSWFPEYQRHPFMLFVAAYTDPYLNIFRSIIPPLGMLDLSPIVALIALSFLENLLLMLIR